MSETTKQNRNVRVIAMAALVLVVGGLSAAPSASAATVSGGGGDGCVSEFYDMMTNPTYGRFWNPLDVIECLI